MLGYNTQQGLPIKGRQFALYEFQCLDDAWAKLARVEEGIKGEHGLHLVFPDSASRAFFQERYGGRLKAQALYFTPASFLDFVLKHLNLEASFIQEPPCLALVAEAVQSLGSHPLADLFKQRPDYFLSLLPVLSPKTRGYFPAYLYQLKAKLEASLEVYQLQSLSMHGERIVGKIYHPIFSHLIFWGFNGKDWEHSLSFLLGLYNGEQVLFFLQHFPGRAQELLISTLEAYSGLECQYIAKEGRVSQSPVHAVGSPDLKLASSPWGLEDVLLAKIRAHHPSSQPLVLVFSKEDSSSGLGLGLRLDALGISYFSALRRPLRLPKELYLLKYWIVYQKELSVYALLDWLNALLCEKYPLLLEKLRKALKPALSLYATHHAPVLLKALEPNLKQYPWLLALLEPLDKQASLNTFSEALITLSSVGALGWESFLPLSSPERLLGSRLQASSFILYLEGILQDQLDALQEPQPSHTSPSVYLLTPELALQMPGAELILADLNEALAYPPKHPLLNEASLFRLNALHVLQGPDGEGQECLALPIPYLLNPLAREADTLFALRELACMPSLSQVYFSELATGSSPTDRLTHPYVQALGEALAWDKATLEAKISYADASTVGSCTRSLPEAAKDQLHIAHSSRRDPSLPFNAYSFCLYPEDALTLILPAKAWEAFFQSPSSVWFQHILRVEKWLRPNETPASALLIGTWVHDWLTLPSGSKSVDLKAPSFLLKYVSQKAQQALIHLRAIYQAAGIALHPRLVDDWKKAQSVALDLAQAVEASGRPFVVSEWSLPDSSTFLLPQGSSLVLRGRMDAIVSPSPIDLSQPAVYNKTPLWILDFKTGKTPPLSLAKVQKDGTGLQIALYALALRSLGFQQVYCSVVRPKEALEPQLCLTDLDELEEIYSKMEALLQKGTFGLQPLPYTTSQSPYPIAFLPIPDSILEAKAALS